MAALLEVFILFSETSIFSAVHPFPGEGLRDAVAPGDTSSFTREGPEGPVMSKTTAPEVDRNQS